ncbi:MAG: decaprenyl-phosphate phosphoribosyltransferase [Vicinamibacterales bacterium]
MARGPLLATNQVSPLPAGGVADRRPMPAALFLSLRPRQWSKNLIVFAGLIFGGNLLDHHAVLSATMAFLVFCMLSGVVYLINDVKDCAADRLHPTKCRRPIAAGDLSARSALSLALVLATVALAVSFGLSLTFGAIALAYVILLVLYSASLKHLVILDVLTIAVGFVLRAWAGAVAVHVNVSHWLLLLTLLGALVLGLGKRRAELTSLADAAAGHRRILAEYSPYLLDQMISVVTASTLLAYAFYTTDPQTVAKFGTDHLLWTVPFPLYGIFRYLYLVHQREGGGDPSEMLVTDAPLIVCGALWGAAIITILYGPLR